MSFLHFEIYKSSIIHEVGSLHYKYFLCKKSTYMSFIFKFLPEMPLFKLKFIDIVSFWILHTASSAKTRSSKHLHWFAFGNHQLKQVCTDLPIVRLNMIMIRFFRAIWYIRLRDRMNLNVQQQMPWIVVCNISRRKEYDRDFVYYSATTRYCVVTMQFNGQLFNGPLLLPLPQCFCSTSQLCIAKSSNNCKVSIMITVSCCAEWNKYK